jgi:DNA-binding IclR family transcriptional regulator
VLDLLVASPEREFKLAEIVAALGIHKSTCHAIVTTMVERGYLVRSTGSKAYMLGSAVILAGHAAERANPAVHAARTVVPALARDLDVESVASVVERDVITVIEWAARPSSGRTVHRPTSWSHVGQRVPLVPPFGAAHMAWSGPARIDEWLERAAGMADDRELRDSIAAIRHRGFDVQVENADLDRFRTMLAAIDLDRLSTTTRAAVSQLAAELGHVEYLPVELTADRAYDINALAAIVFDPAGGPILTLSVHPGEPLLGVDVMTMGRRLRAVADGVTESIGGVPPP